MTQAIIKKIIAFWSPHTYIIQASDIEQKCGSRDEELKRVFCEQSIDCDGIIAGEKRSKSNWNCSKTSLVFLKPVKIIQKLEEIF